MKPAAAMLDMEDEDGAEDRQELALLRNAYMSACGELDADADWIERTTCDRHDDIKQLAVFVQAAQDGWVRPAPVQSIEDQLAGLAAEWRRTRQKTSSSVVALAMHPAYQRIIGQGKAALPFILNQLERAPDHWFWALSAITGEDPVAEEDRGDLEAMARSWLAWGRQCGYI